MCVQGLALAVLVVIRGVSCVCLWGVFLFLCTSGVCVSSVHSLIVQSAEFCIVCNLFMFEFDMIMDQIVLAHSRMGLVIVFLCYVKCVFGLPPVC